LQAAAQGGSPAILLVDVIQSLLKGLLLLALGFALLGARPLEFVDDVREFLLESKRGKGDLDGQLFRFHARVSPSVCALHIIAHFLAGDKLAELGEYLLVSR